MIIVRLIISRTSKNGFIYKLTMHWVVYDTYKDNHFHADNLTTHRHHTMRVSKLINCLYATFMTFDCTRTKSEIFSEKR